MRFIDGHGHLETDMRDWKLTAALFGLASIAILGALVEGFSILLVIVSAIGVVAFLWFAFKHPEVFLVAALFIPQLKAYWPLRPLDHAVDLTVAMLAGLLLGICWKMLKLSARIDAGPKPKFGFLPRWPLFGFALFAGVVALSYIYTPAVSYGGTELVRFLGIGTLLLVAPFVIIRNEEDLRRFVMLFLGVGAILALQMILHLEDRQSSSATDITRIGAGWLMGMLILLALYYRPFQRPKYNTAEAWILVPIFSFALIASAARGPIVALLVVLILNLVASTRKVSKIVVTLLLLGVSAYAAFAIFSHVDPSKYNSKLTEIEDLVEGKAASGSAVKRFTYYRETLAAIPSHLLLGGGIGSWSVFYYGTDERGYPHNLFLEVAFEEGLLGLAALSFFLFAMGVASLRLLRATGTRYAVFPSLVLFCVIVSMFSGDLDDNRVLWYWAGVTLTVCAITIARFRDSVARRFVFCEASESHVRPLPPIEVNGPFSPVS
ncbi:MAG: O-antigen ligase family protein [Candidatus Acidiferrales bacterium]